MITDITDLIASAIVIWIALVFIVWLILWSLNLVIKAAFPEWYRRYIADDAPDGHW